MRRKSQQDNKARLRQMQAERNMMAKQQPAAKAPEMEVEERPFTEAEMELFNSKYAPYQKAGEEVNACLAFLKKQHGIKDGEGWQLGQRGFVRQIPKQQVADKPKGTKAKADPAKAQTKPEPPPPPPRAPVEEHTDEHVHQNGTGPVREALPPAA